MSRVSLQQGDIVSSQTCQYFIDSVIGDGATGIVYDAHYVDNANHSHVVRLKEFYPYTAIINREGYELVWDSDDNRLAQMVAFKNGYDKLMKRQNSNFTVHAFDMFEANGTLYIVMDANDGITFDKDKASSLKEILMTVKLLAYAVGEYHKNGYLHLDVKPSNFLVYPRPSEHIVLFDIDSITAINDIAEKRAKAVSYSKGWAAPEQMQGKIDKLCPATDIYGIGAVLFEKVIGKTVENSDIGIFANWEFKGPLFEKVNPKIKRLLRDIFHKTLAANVKRRYQTVEELIVVLDNAIAVCDEDQFIVSSCPPSEILFVGREKELNVIHEKFVDGVKTVFLHAFGGNGKTELAKKYAELYGDEYDTILFKKYESENATLEQIIEGIKIVHEDKEEDHFSQLDRVCNESKVLLIVDNFDTEDDDYINELLTLNLHIIFTTRNDFSSYFAANENIYVHELGTLSTDELLRIFCNEYQRPLLVQEREDVCKIIESFDNLTYAVPIIAKQILFSGITVNDYLNRIQSDGLCLSEDTDNIRIRINGKFVKKTPMDLYRYLYNISVLTKAQVNALRNLYCLKEHNSLTKERYKYYTGERSLNSVNDLIFLNWVKYDQTNDELSLHPIIVELINTDLDITPQTVPGIYNFIRQRFEELSACNTIDQAQVVSYALLIYTELYEADNNKNEMLQLLGDFIIKFAVSDFQSVYSRLFSETEESTWYPLSNWWMSRILAVYSNLSIVPEGEKEVEELSEYESGQLLARTMNQLVLLVFRTACLLKNNVKLTESDFLFLDINEQTVLVFLPILNLYASLGCRVDYDVNGELNSSEKWVPDIPTPDTYGYYAFMINAIQKTIKCLIEFGITSDEDMKQQYKEMGWFEQLTLKGLEELCTLATQLIIQVEQSLGRFCFYDAALLMEYKAPSEEEYKKEFEGYNKKHWAHKSRSWYNSVEKALKTTMYPIGIYKLLLTWDYHAKHLQVSQTGELVKHNLVEMIIDDDRLSTEERSQLLLGHVSRQLGGKIDHISKLRNRTPFLQKHKHILDLYAKAFSIPFAEYALSELKFDSMDEVIGYYSVLASMYELMGMELCGFKKALLNDVKAENAIYFDEFLWMAQTIKKAGDKTTSKRLKIKLLDECLKIDWACLPESTIQIIDFKLKPWAVKYGREDVVQYIDAANQSIYRKYHIGIRDSETLTVRERKGIYQGLFVSCVEAIGNYYYAQSNGLNVPYPTEIIKHTQEVIESIRESTDNDAYCVTGYPYFYLSILDIINNKEPFDFYALLGENSWTHDCYEGLCIKVLKDASMLYWQQLDKGFFYDLIEDKNYPDERRKIFKDKLLQLRPDCKRIIEKLL